MSDDLDIPVFLDRRQQRSRRLTDEEGKALGRLLVKLKDCELGDWDADFVDDMAKRISRHGPEIYLSARQEEQLDRLKRQHRLENLK